MKWPYVALGLLWVGRSAAAQEPPEPAPAVGSLHQSDAQKRARKQFEEALSNFQQGRMGSARAAFEEAYRLYGAPDLLFNIGVVATELDKPEDAVRYFERYLRERRDAPDRAEVEERVRRLRLRLAEERAERQRQEDRARAAASTEVRRRRPLPALGLIVGGGVVLLSGIAVGASAAGIAAHLNGSQRFDPELDQTGRALVPAGVALDVVGGAMVGAGAAWWLAWRLRRGT